MFKLTTSVMGSIDKPSRSPMGPVVFYPPTSATTASPLSQPIVTPDPDDGDGDDVQEPHSAQHFKPLDANRYATKKTIAQGMLDIALLTANASQLKYVLTVGQQHQFYSLMIGLITVSIVLQIVQAIISLVLGSAYNINKAGDQRSANCWNNLALSLIIITVAINVVISAFDMRETNSLPGTLRNGTLGGNATSLIGRLLGL